MGVFKVPRATTVQRTAVVIEKAEIVFDTDQNTYYGGDGVTLGGFPLTPAPAPAPTHVNIVLNATDILNKYVTLPSTPIYPSSVMLLPEGGPHQRYGIDFSISGDTLTWNGLGLENFLNSGETITVSY